MNASKLPIDAANSALLSSLYCPNINEKPKLISLTLSVNITSANAQNDFFCEQLQDDLYTLCDQEVLYSRAKKSNSILERRKGMIIAATIKMRNKKMLNFLNNIINFTTLNIRDFEGFFCKSFDKKGNYTFSNVNRLAFEELEFNEDFRKEKFVITLQISAKKPKNCFFFLKSLGFPFKI